MQHIDGSDIFFQKAHGIIIETILPSSIGLSLLPNFTGL